MKAWKSGIVEGRITPQDLRQLIEKTVAVSQRTTLRLFAIVHVAPGVTQHVDIHHAEGIHFELLTQDAADATKQG